jgi:hypothetical protein
MLISQDNSPYFLKFNLDNVNLRLSEFKSILPKYLFEDDVSDKLYHIYDLSKFEINHFFNLIPLNDITEWHDIVRVVSVKKGFVGPLHKDGINAKSSINIGIHVKNSDCTTYWFDDEKINIKSESKKMELDGKNINSRNADGIDWRNIEPSAKTVLEQNELILFNSNIYHTWDNLTGENARVTLKLRPRKDLDFSILKETVLDYYEKR